VSQQIYSLPPLATWVSYQHQPIKRRAISLNPMGMSTNHHFLR